MGHFLVDSIPEKEKIVGMPRQIRIEDPGALYHLLDRGDRREDIFLDDADRQDFIKILAETCLKTDWQVHADCLMQNHFHLAVETPQANLVPGMSWLGATQERSGQAGDGSPITARLHLGTSKSTIVGRHVWMREKTYEPRGPGSAPTQK